MNITTRTTVTMPVKRSKNQLKVWKLKNDEFVVGAYTVASCADDCCRCFCWYRMKSCAMTMFIKAG